MASQVKSLRAGSDGFRTTFLAFPSFVFLATEPTRPSTSRWSYIDILRCPRVTITAIKPGSFGGSLVLRCCFKTEMVRVNAFLMEALEPSEAGTISVMTLMVNRHPFWNRAKPSDPLRAVGQPRPLFIGDHPVPTMIRGSLPYPASSIVLDNPRCDALFKRAPLDVAVLHGLTRNKGVPVPAPAVVMHRTPATLTGSAGTFGYEALHRPRLSSLVRRWGKYRTEITRAIFVISGVVMGCP